MLNKLVSPKSTKKSKKIGRGMGSGVGGHTVGRGGKGATARSGYQYPSKVFEGGQMPLSRRLPKLKGETAGLTREHFRKNQEKIVINLSKIENAVKNTNYKGDITINTLVDLGLFKPKYNKISVLKILFDKSISTKMNFRGLSMSKKAQEAVTRVGGSVE